MTKAQRIAELVSARIISEGHLAGDKNHVGNPVAGASFAADLGQQDEYEETDLYRNLEVVSVVFRNGKQGEGEGGNIEDEVVIHAKGRMTKEFLASMSKEIDGVKVTVEESTLVHVDPEEAFKYSGGALFYERNGMIACGSSCATATGFPGTLGALVAREGEDGLFVLSCNHVLAACDVIRRGMPIIAPAPDDAKPEGSLPLSIARLTKSMPMQHGHYSHENLCEIDAAVGKVVAPDRLTSWQGSDDHFGYDTPTKIVDPTYPMKVKKFGRTTGLTHGFITGEGAGNMAVPYEAKKFKGTMWFKNHVAVASNRGAFALPGDSGSLVVTGDGEAAVGLLFSINSKGDKAYIIPIRRVLEAFGATLVSGFNT
ncbi:MAG: hypothetical protein U0800_07930 [Isosphaeraceae bacterium]